MSSSQKWGRGGVLIGRKLSKFTALSQVAIKFILSMDMAYGHPLLYHLAVPLQATVEETRLCKVIRMSILDRKS